MLRKEKMLEFVFAATPRGWQMFQGDVTAGIEASWASAIDVTVAELNA